MTTMERRWRSSSRRHSTTGQHVRRHSSQKGERASLPYLFDRRWLCGHCSTDHDKRARQNSTPPPSMRMPLPGVCPSALQQLKKFQHPKRFRCFMPALFISLPISVSSSLLLPFNLSTSTHWLKPSAASLNSLRQLFCFLRCLFTLELAGPAVCRC